MKYAISIKRFFYGPSTTLSLVTQDGSEFMQFETRKQAQEEIARMESCVYYLSHNESGRPKYQVLKLGSRAFQSRRHMKTQHTPRPWKVSPECRYVCRGDTEWDCANPNDERSEQRWICKSGSVICTLTDAEEQPANARLIAAAPDLLEACKAFYHVECEKFSSDPFNRDSQPDSPVQKAWLLAVAAIAKAEGREGAAVD